jgi:hypothetical protein
VILRKQRRNLIMTHAESYYYFQQDHHLYDATYLLEELIVMIYQLTFFGIGIYKI